MDHFWQDIEGYFTFPLFYEEMAAVLANTASYWRARGEPRRIHVVEVGVYTGQSAAFLGVELVNRGVDAQLDLVDIEMTKHGARDNLSRLASTDVLGHFHEIDSVAASRLYKDDSLDFAFIDADHSYAAVSRDIDAWLPKVRKGGIIAGHDYCNWPGFGVIEAVTERFDRVEVWRGSKGMGDAQMQPRYWPVWMVRV
jgi:predicted O-methyltransferase YrrM